MAALNLGDEFEQAIISAAGLEGLNLDPGSMEIGLLNDPTTTVRFTLVVDVPYEAVRAAIADAIE
ncbi:hypothetical protein [Microbacterium sp. Leaf320]|uniref:hypothetical protein n=1 Tax=Microbacterium sp. Leaf320 TaxID=1736334 RepID=UPI0006FE0590|nr:hypothetical protein [Microbacterium sp. Leaf320]KQQ65085.1 hypothetical protein ASF63_14045 [Microbacterium sp. Leaf320]